MHIWGGILLLLLTFAEFCLLEASECFAIEEGGGLVVPIPNPSKWWYKGQKKDGDRVGGTLRPAYLHVKGVPGGIAANPSRGAVASTHLTRCEACIMFGGGSSRGKGESTSIYFTYANSETGAVERSPECDAEVEFDFTLDCIVECSDDDDDDDDDENVNDANKLLISTSIVHPDTHTEHPLRIKVGEDVNDSISRFVESSLGFVPDTGLFTDAVAQVTNLVMKGIERRSTARKSLHSDLSALDGVGFVMILGAGVEDYEQEKKHQMLILTDENTLDITDPAEFERDGISHISEFVAEHVLEHLSLDDGVRAARNIHRQNCTFRIAVPDSFQHSDDRIRADLRDGHAVQYSKSLLLRTLVAGGFKDLIVNEWVDERGENVFYPSGGGGGGRVGKDVYNFRRSAFGGRRGSSLIVTASSIDKYTSELTREGKHAVAVGTNGKSKKLQIFTLVLNGMPWLKHHLAVFKNAVRMINAGKPVKEHIDFEWHLVEGLAVGRADARSPYSSSSIPDGYTTAEGLSTDGTSEYIDKLTKAYPENVHAIRRVAWKDKIEMVNAALSNIGFTEEAILMEIDVDELWSSKMISEMYKMMTEREGEREAQAEKKCAYFHCHFFVQKNKVTATLGGYGHGVDEWLRVWKYKTGDYFLLHAPPVLVTREDSRGKPLGLIGSEICHTHDETLQRGIAFSHYSYVDSDSVRFKGFFYGYATEDDENVMLAKWRELEEVKGEARATDYLTWLQRGSKNWEPRFEHTTIVDIRETPIASDVEVVEVMSEGEAGIEGVGFAGAIKWSEGEVDCKELVAIDLVAFQMEQKGGIARVWESILPRIVKRGLGHGKCFLLLDRGMHGRRELGETLELLEQRPGVRVMSLPLFDVEIDEENPDYFTSDSEMLGKILLKQGATIFLSTLYTFPSHIDVGNKISVRTIIHDLTPELLGWKLDGIWAQKAASIRRRGDSDRIVCVSNTTRKRMSEFYPDVGECSVSPNGIDIDVFNPTKVAKKELELGKFGLDGDNFILLVGKRLGYKSGMSLFTTLNLVDDLNGLKIVLVGGNPVQDVEVKSWKAGGYTRDVIDLTQNIISDVDLHKLYQSAVALVYLSLDEGFGLPVLECLASGGRVIASDIEVLREISTGFDNIKFVNPASPRQIWAAIVGFQRELTMENSFLNGIDIDIDIDIDNDIDIDIDIGIDIDIDNDIDPQKIMNGMKERWNLLAGALIDDDKT